VNLRYVDQILRNRKEISNRYDNYLLGKDITTPVIAKNSVWNNGNYPVIFKDERTCIQVFKELEIRSVSCRRYFYPSLTKLDYVREQSMPISDDISKRILCLPLYFGLEMEEVDMICRFILRT